MWLNDNLATLKIDTSKIKGIFKILEISKSINLCPNMSNLFLFVLSGVIAYFHESRSAQDTKLDSNQMLRKR